MAISNLVLLLIISRRVLCSTDDINEKLIWFSGFEAHSCVFLHAMKAFIASGDLVKHSILILIEFKTFQKIPVCVQTL
jgi:hypothetical protein